MSETFIRWEQPHPAPADRPLERSLRDNPGKWALVAENVAYDGCAAREPIATLKRKPDFEWDYRVLERRPGSDTPTRVNLYARHNPEKRCPTCGLAPDGSA